MAARKHSVRSEVKEKGSELMWQAQHRVTRAMSGSRPEDVLIKSALGAVAAGLFVRLIRQTPFGAIAARLAPMVAFVALYESFSTRTRSR